MYVTNVDKLRLVDQGSAKPVVLCVGVQKGCGNRAHRPPGLPQSLHLLPSSSFFEPLGAFTFSTHLERWVVPFGRTGFCQIFALKFTMQSLRPTHTTFLVLLSFFFLFSAQVNALPLRARQANSPGGSTTVSTTKTTDT